MKNNKLCVALQVKFFGCTGEYWCDQFNAIMQAAWPKFEKMGIHSLPTLQMEILLEKEKKILYCATGEIFLDAQRSIAFRWRFCLKKN